MRIAIPERVWEEALDPRASGMQAEFGLSEPGHIRRGRGWTAVYENATVEQARELADHLADMGALWLANSDPEYDQRERGVYREMLRTAERIRGEVAGE